MTQGVYELLLIKKKPGRLSNQSKNPMRLYYDNKSATSIADNPTQHDQSKHIEIDRYSIKKNLKNGLICTTYVPTNSEFVNILNKDVSDLIF